MRSLGQWRTTRNVLLRDLSRAVMLHWQSSMDHPWQPERREISSPHRRRRSTHLCFRIFIQTQILRTENLPVFVVERIPVFAADKPVLEAFNKLVEVIV